MSALEELNSLLLSLSALKPPGANKSKITTITNLCINNATQCPALLQAISNRFSAAESTHKLGVLYVLDAVVRQWNEKARQNKEDAMASGYDPAKTPNAVGVSIATQMLTPMMNDLIQSAPEDQKEKISKMIEIWERGNTFPQQMLADFKQRLGARKTTETYTANAGHAQNLMQPLAANQSAVGTPANFGPGPASQAQTSTPTVATSNAQPSGTVSLLASLANLGKQASTPTPMAVQQNGAQYVVPAQQPQQHSVGPSVTAAPMPPYSTPAQGQGNGATGYSIPAPAPAPTSTAPSQSAPQAIPGMPPGVGNDQFVQFLASLVQQGWSPEQIGQIFTAMQGGAQNQTASANNAVAFSQNGQAQVGANGQSQPTEQVAQDPRLRDNTARTHDRNHDRSPSPDRKRRRMSPVNRRDSPTYGIYDPTNNASHASNAGPSAQPPPPPPPPPPAPAAAAATEQGGATRGRGRKGKKRDKHRNSPAVNPGPPIPTGPAAQQQKPAGPPREKYVQHDSSLPDGNIKVLSRTLFVGGVSGTEQELRSIFSQFGSVQTCIVNPEKHHAFVKMVNRTDSVAAKLGMEKMKDPAVLGKARQTRWGVGFGPRECSDYSTGISIIPINRLTEADLKWVVNSEYGGTGGRPLETGMVIEEPDIEIGTGVSSKAMSKRVGPEPGGGRHFGRHGHHHGHRGGGGGGGGGGGFDPHAPRFRKPDPRPPQGGEPRPEPHTIGVPPPVPGFGFQLPGV